MCEVSEVGSYGGRGGEEGKVKGSKKGEGGGRQ